MIFVAFDSSGTQINLTNQVSYRDLRTDLTWFTINEDIENVNLNDNWYERNTSNGTISLVSRPPVAPPDLNSMDLGIELNGLVVSEQLYFEGGGINSINTQGYLRRFNGMIVDNRTGMFFEKGALIELIEFTCDNNTSNRRFQIQHYNRGGGDRQIVFDDSITEENNQFLYRENLNIIIPARRRFAPFITGADFRYPQYRIGYRRIF